MTTTLDPDRRVHVLLRDDSMVVRYTRSGTWYREWPASAMIARRSLKIRDAVAYALSEDAVEVNYGLPGGTMFDQQVRRRRAETQAAQEWAQEQGDHREQ